MSALAYTSIYQMTYLLLETAEGKLTNRMVNESFEPFLLDLIEAIETNEWPHLEPVRNSILEYYRTDVKTEQGIENLLGKIEDMFNAWHVSCPEILRLAREVLKELL